MEQPTAMELIAALRIAREIGTVEAARDLQRIRDRRATWYGSLDCALRNEIDSYLASALPA